MRAKIGDVVIDKTYNKRGNLAIVVGEGISQPILIGHRGGITMDKLRDYFAVWDGLEVIGHIDFEKIWEEALKINEPNSSEKPNNCEECKHWNDTEDDCADRHGCRTTTEDCSTVPTSSKMEQVETMSCAECKHRPIGAEICEEPCHYEPQTDWHYDEQDATWYPYKHKDEPQTERSE